MNNTIKTVFGNHDDLQLFVKYVLSNDVDDMPPFPPLLFRMVNGPDAEFINCKSKHNRLMKLMSSELAVKYSNYVK